MSDREAFEHWYADYTGDAHIRKYCDSTGRYQFNAMQSAWEAWQAALQSGEPVVPDKELAKRVAKRRRQFEALCAQVRDPQADKGFNYEA